MAHARKIVMAHLALRNVLRNWRHSLATVVAIVSGFVAVALFDGYILDLREQVSTSAINRGMLGHVIIEKQGARTHHFEDPWEYSLGTPEQRFVERFMLPWKKDGRESAALRVLLVNGLISNGRSSALFLGIGYEVQEGLVFRGDRWAWDAIDGKPLHLATGPAAMIGKGLAARFDAKLPGQQLQLSVTTEKSQVNAVNLAAIGAVDLMTREVNDTYVALPLRTAQELLDTDQISRMCVLLSDPAAAPLFIREFTAAAAKAGLPLTAIPWLDHPAAAVAKGGLEILSVFRNLFLLVVLVVAGMSVANTVMKSVNERVREIGTLRSYGFRARDVQFLFSFEGLLLGFFSCAAGIAVAAGAGVLISSLGITYEAGVLSTPIPLRISVALGAWAASAAGMSLITFSAAWLVSGKRSRLVIAESLRYVA